MAQFRSPTVVRRPRRWPAFLALFSLVASLLTGLAGVADATPASDGNPDLPDQCGMDMTLIIDRSGSIGSLNDEVADAANALVQGLAGTGSSVQVISFSQTATALDDVSGDGDNDDLADLEFVPADTLTVPIFPSGGWTNWDDALEMARRSPAGIAPLTVILTDGNPTAYNNVTPDGHGLGTTAGGGGAIGATALARAKVEADLVQAAGSHILALGVGSGINTANLEDLAGDEEYTVGGSVPFTEADWTVVSFAQLQPLLEEVVKDLCSPSVNIVKTEIPLVGDPRPGDGYDFDIELGASPGSFGGFWQNPVLPAVDTNASLSTIDGKVNFKWEFGGPSDSTSLSVTEGAQAGWELTAVECDRRDFDTGDTTSLTITPVVNLDGSVTWSIPGGIGAADAINCSVENTELPPAGSITVVKHAIGTDGTFPFSSDFNGDFDLITSGGSASTGQIVVDAGTYAVSESVAAPWSLTSAVCDDGSPVDAIVVSPGEDVVCTFTNTAPDPTIAVTKTADPTTVPEPGATVTFTVDIDNTSIEPVTITAIVDSVDGGAAFDVTALPVNTCAALIGTTLAPHGQGGDSVSCAFDLFVAGNGGDTVTDVATVAGQDDDGTGVIDADDALVGVVDVLPGVTLTKSANVSEVPEPGADVDFTFLVENTSPEPLTISELSDSVYGDITLDCGWAGLVLAAADATVGSGPDAATCTLTLPVTGDASQTHTNVATVTGSDDEGNEAVDSDDETVDITDVLPGVTLAKSANVAEVPEPGADVDFTFLVENTSPEPLTISELSDSVYGDITADCGWAGSVLAPADGALGSGADSATCTLTRFVGGNGGDVHTNIATVTGTDDDDNEVSDSDDESVDITDVLPTIDADKTADTTVVPEPGANVTFTAAVLNTSVEPVTITGLTDSVDGSAPFDVTSVGGDVLATTCGDAVGTELDPGESYSCQFVLYVSGNAGDAISDTIEFTVEDDEGNEATDDADEDVDVDDLLPGVTITKSADPVTVPEPGDDVDFTFVIENDSVEAVTITELTDSIFGDILAECGLDGAILAPSDGVAGSGPDATLCQIERFVGGNAGFVHLNVATVTVADDDGNEASDDDDATVDVSDVEPTVSATKNGTPSAVPEPGANVTFTASVTNTSVEPVTITGVTDAVDGGDAFDVTVVAGPVLSTTCGDAVGTELAPGGSYSCEFVIFVAGNAGDEVTDVIEFTVVDDDGNETTDEDDEDTDVDDVEPGLTITKSAGAAEVAEPGANVTFGLEVTNPSVEVVTITALTDAVDGGAAFDVTVVAGPVLSTTCGDAIGTALAPTESYSCAFTVFVAGNGGDIVNDVAVVAGVDDEGNETTDEDDEDVDVIDAEPGVSITKNANVSEVPEPGADVEFSFLIENTSVEPVTITSLVDSVFGDIAAECGVDGAVLAASDGAVGSGDDTVTCTITRYVGGNAGDLHTNVVTVTAVDDEGNETTDDDDEDVDVIDAEPGVSITKNANVSEVPEPGADVEFSFLIENTSVEPVTITSLVDSVFGDIAAECGVDGAVLAASDGAVGSGDDTATCTITRYVGGNAGDLHTNVVTVTAVDDEGNETTHDDDEEVDVTDVLPGITVVKSASLAEVTEPGADVDFTFVVTNPSVEPITITSLVDSVFGDIAAECAMAGAVLAAGATAECTITRFIGGNAGDLHTNVVTVTAADDEGNETTDDDDEDVDIVDALPSPVITKSASVAEVPEPGADVDFTFVVTNTSVEPITITSLVDSVFGDIAEECGLAAAVLAVAETVSCTITRFIGGNAGDLHANVVTVSAVDDDDNEVTDEDDEEVDIVDELPTIETTKDDGGVSVEAPGGVVTFTVEVENTSVEPVTIVSITDVVDGGDPIDVTVVAGPVSATDCATGVEIPIGDTYTCSFDLLVEGDGSAPVVDTINVVVTDDEGNTTDDDDNETTPVDPVADLSIVKTTDADAPSAGDTVTYSLVITNNGPSTAEEVVVVDELPAGLEFVSVSTGLGWDCSVPAADSVECRILALPSGAVETITITATVRDGAAGSIVNVGTVSSETPDPAPDNNEDPEEIVVVVVTPPAPEPEPTSPPLAVTGRSILGTFMIALVLLGMGGTISGGVALTRRGIPQD